MLDFKLVKEKNQSVLETSVSGKLLLTIPQLNKGTAFTLKERHEFGLMGKLPMQVETLEEQVKRAYLQYESHNTKLLQNIYLNNLNETNQVLFYKLVQDHLEEMMPTIYTPIVGTAVKEFSREFRRPRGLYISYEDRDNIEEILDNRSHPDIDLIVVSDGEGVLGIGDQGVGAMDIPVAKLMVYTLMAGINPLNTLPILLDAGTNNETLLNDPLYLGWRHKRVTGKDYDEFINKFVDAIKKKFPNVFLHWEDFGRDNAWHNLTRFKNELCTFNDDIQGTGVVTLAALFSALKSLDADIKEQRIVLFGPGSAGIGIADQICAAMVREGITPEEARSRFWMIGRHGLLFNDNPRIIPAQVPYARTHDETKGWQTDENGLVSLLETINQVKPTILIGCSTVAGAFDEMIIKTMAKHVKCPIIFPLSNPTENSEANPADILGWTNNKAKIATGSPFPDIAQCNNAYAFPGIGLGVIAVKAKRLTDEMLWVACQTLANAAPVLHDKNSALLPSLHGGRAASRAIAIAVAKQAQKEGLAQIEGDAEQLVNACIWEPHYTPYRKA